MIRIDAFINILFSDHICLNWILLWWFQGVEFCFKSNGDKYMIIALYMYRCKKQEDNADDTHDCRLFIMGYIWTLHYNDIIMGTIVSQITSLTIVYSIVYSDPEHRKYQSSASLAFVRGIHRGPVNSPHKWPVTWKMFPFDDVIVLM